MTLTPRPRNPLEVQADVAALRRGNRVDQWGDTFTVDGALNAVRPPWMRDATCNDHPQDLWFPERGDTGDDAKAICEGCLVRAECLAHGLREEVGIFGGASRKERKRLVARGWTAGDPLPPVVMRTTGLSHGAQRAYHAHLRAGETPCPMCKAWKDRRRAQQRRLHAAKVRASLNVVDGAA